MVTWTYVIAHTPGGPKIPAEITASDGTTYDVSDKIIAPSTMPDTLVTDAGAITRHMGEAWCARAPYSIDVVADVAPDKKDSPWVVPFWVYDNITIEAAAQKGLTICVRPAWKFIQNNYPNVYQSMRVPCAVPAEAYCSGGAVPVIATFPLYDADGYKIDLVNEVKSAVDKATVAGYEPVFCLYFNIYTESDITTAADIIKELSNAYGAPATLKDCERAVRSNDKIQLDSISSLLWEALRLHDIFYDYKNAGLNETARKHGFAASLRAIASLSTVAKARAPVPRGEHNSLLYDANLPVPSILHDEQSLSSTIRMWVHLGYTNADKYHNLVRDFEVASRAAVAPFPM